MTNRYEYISQDKRYSLRIFRHELMEILELCSDTRTNETGGRLLGYYNRKRDCAIVTHVTPPSVDTKSGRTWITLGVKGLKIIFDYFWYKRRIYYIGDWHFHPFSSSSPSATDMSQLAHISQSDQYNCPEPVLLIIGGDPKKHWTSSAHIHVRNAHFIHLKQRR